MGKIVLFKPNQARARSNVTKTGNTDVVDRLEGKISLFRPIDSAMNSNYVSISRIRGNVADELVKLGSVHEVRDFWIDLRVLEKYLSGLGKDDLEVTVLVNIDPFGIPQSPLEDDYLEAAIYSFNPNTRQVRLTPTPFYAGSYAAYYFVKKKFVG